MNTINEEREGISAEEALRQSEERFRMFIAAGSSIVYRMNTDWSRMEQLVGNDLLADTTQPTTSWMNKYILPEDQPQVWTAIQQAIATKTIFEQDHRVMQADGSVGWVQSRAIPLLNEQGEITEWFGVGTDITQRKLAERRQAFLLKLSDALSMLVDSAEMERAATRMLGEELAADRAFFATIDANSDSYSIRYDYAVDLPSQIGRHSMTEFQRGRLLQWQAGRMSSVDNSETDPLLSAAERAAYAAFDTRAVIGVPLVKAGRFAALLSVNQTRPRVWTRAELALTQETAERTWAAIERARAEESLNKSEEKYRTLFNSIDEGVATIELLFDEQDNAVDFRWLATNPAMARLSGLSMDVIGKRSSEVFRNLEPFWLETYGRVAKTGEPIRFEYGAAELAGRMWDVYASRLGGQGSNEIVVVYNDITERKRGEANLAFLAEVSQDLARLTNIDETMNVIGAKFAAYFGLSACVFAEQEFKDGVQYSYINHGWHRSDTPSLLGTYRMREFMTQEMIDMCYAGEDIVIHDVFADPKTDGAKFAAINVGSFVGIPLVRYGEWRFLLVVYRSEPYDWREDEIDLLREINNRIWTRLERARAEAALKISEERLRISLEAGELATWDWHMETDQVVWNDQHYLLFGRQPDERQIHPHDFLHHVHREDVNYVEQQLKEAIEETGVYKAEFRIIRDDNGKIRWMNGYGRVTERTGEKATRMTGVMIDVTERKRMEQQKDEFLNIASHELKTPVTSIKAYAELLQESFEEASDDLNADLMQKMNVQIDRLTTLISALLDTTKISEGQLQLYLEYFDLANLINERIDELQRVSVNHKLIVDLCPVHQVLADRERISQVFTNLISNATKYSPKGGEVRVNCTHDGQEIRVSVRDQGIGIAEEMQAKVFDRFFRADNVQVQTFSGLGLGLYITAGIVQRHGGRIWVESKLGEGSTFYFTLPVYKHDV